MRLIDADTLIEKCGEWYTEEGSEEGYIGTLKQLLDKQPTIEPKQGKWIITEQDNGHKWTHRKCSECGKGIIEPLGVSGMNFCPNCGARMKGVNNE